MEFKAKFTKEDYNKLAAKDGITKTEAYVLLEAPGLAILQGYSEEEAKIRLCIAKGLRNDMDMHGTKEDGTQAAHRFPNSWIKELILDSNTPVQCIEHFSSFGGKKGHNGNLRMVPKKHNDRHSGLEKEIKQGKGMSSDALKRIVEIIGPSVEYSEKLSQAEKRLLYRKIDEKLLLNNKDDLATQLLTGYSLNKDRVSRDMLCTLSGIQTDLRFNQNGSISKTSLLVKNGDVILNHNGEVDPKSPAVLSGKVRLNKDGSVDERCSATQVSLSDKTWVKGYKRTDGTNVSGYFKNSEKQELKSPSREPTCTTKLTEKKFETPTKQDGTPDMRYSVNKTPEKSPVHVITPTKSDGTPDMRFSVNQRSPPPKLSPVTPTKSDNTPDMRYSVNKQLYGGSSSGSSSYSSPYSSPYSSSYSSSGPCKKDGSPDMRYSSNKGGKRK